MGSAGRWLLLWCAGLPALAVAADSRFFEFSYEMLAEALPSTEAVDIYLPLPARDDGQQVLGQSLESTPPGEAGVEATYGNGYYHIHRPANVDTPISANLRWTVRREALASGGGERALSEAERARFLAPNRLVPVGHEILQPILAEIRANRSDDSPEVTARAIYDWVVDNVAYRKVGTGWGNGDTFWACSERYGNCTDFHALFISLARSEGIPARFEIGFPLPLESSGGEIGGYHCWVQYHLPGRGWVPIDASEAAKDPARRERYYGSQPADRIHFTTGRDLALTAAGRQPLNYFIYPYVEVGGRPWQEKVQTRFAFRELPQD
jgi:transglutaminase-like putative cysteine protease